MTWNTRLSFSSLQFPGLLLSVVLLLNGCATLQLPEYEAKPVADYPSLQVKDGLAVAIRPLTDQEDNKTYFGTNLIDANVLPILVVAENRSATSSFLLSKDQFALRSGEATTDNASGREQIGSESGGEAMAIAGAVLVSLPLTFAGTKMISNATVIQSNFAVKELQTRTLSPGRTAQGFVYFRLPENPVTSDQWTVQLEAKEIGSTVIKRFEFPFTWRKE